MTTNDRTKGEFSLRPMSRQLAVIWPFLVTVPLLLAIAIASLQILAAGRAYVEGESLWSKGQKASVYHLLRYVQTKDERDYQRHVEALAVPLGDRIARLELEKPDYDHEVARQGYLQGRNHPEEISGMIALYRLFRNEPHIARVVELWTNGDRHIAAIQSLAVAIHAEVASGREDQKRVRVLIDNLHEINASLTPLTDEFSRTLGDATRWTKRTLIVAMVLLTFTLLGASMVISRRIIRQQQEVESALRNSEARFQLAVSGCNDGIWDWEIDKNTVYYSPRLKQMLGMPASHPPAQVEDLWSRVHPEDRAMTRRMLEEHLESASAYDIEFRIETAPGIYRWMRTRGQSARDEQGKAVRMAGSLSDITDRKVAEAQLYNEKERAQVTLESIGDAVITTDVGGNVEYMNAVAEDLTGHELVAARGKPLGVLLELLDEKTRETPPSLVLTALREQRHVESSGNIVLIRDDGREIAIDQSASPIRDRSGAVTGVVLVLHDVSRERQYSSKLTFLATHDPLTGLVNRREFESRLQHAIDCVANGRREHCVMFLDLDQFKVVNDTNGHGAGDELLRQVSGMISGHMRQSDTLSRLGGDEFGILLEDCPPNAALQVAESIRSSLQNYRFVWGGRTFGIGASVGLVQLRDPDMSLKEVLSAADSACYLAKDRGRNRVQVYRPDDSDLAKRQGEMQWVDHLQRALEQERFELFVQRIVNLQQTGSTGQHVELLVRLRDEAGEYVPPMAFIPAAERFGLMPLIDQWVIRAALQAMEQRRAMGDLSIETCAINLSGTSISDERFLDYVCDQFGAHDVPMGTICFEVTETAAISNLAKAEKVMRTLRELGCRFSLDDFGAGMSSFAYLKHLPVDFVKIDGMFVKEMCRDRISHAMVEAINNIGHVMGKTTIAEFVENEQLLEELRRIGVDFAQGFGIHKPEPLREFSLRTPVLGNSRDLAAEAPGARKPRVSLKQSS